ncbi:MAG: glycosyltransferase family 4 protein [Bdellovibrio sp.]
MAEVRVLHCLHSLSWGGLEIYTVDLIKQLAQTGITQYVFSQEDSKATQELRRHGIEVLPFPEKKLSKLQATWRILQLVKSHRITHIHSHTRLDMWAGCFVRGLCKSSLRHIYSLYMNATPKRDLFHKWLFSHIDALCASSEDLLQEVQRNFPIAREKLHLVRYGRPLEALQPGLFPSKAQGLRQHYKVTNTQTVFGTLCRIDPGKGVRELVESLTHLSDSELAQTQLWIVGDPTLIGSNSEGQPLFEPASKELNDWIAQQQAHPRHGPHLHRIPFQKDYIPYLEALDVFVLASYKETYSLSVLDAMLMEKPVIGTNTGGTPEQIGSQQERGRTVPPHNAVALSEALRFYLTHPGQIPLQGQQARQWVLTHHSWSAPLAQFKKLYYTEE